MTTEHRIALITLLLPLVAGVVSCTGEAPAGNDSATSRAVSGIRYLASDGSGDDGFARATAVQVFSFPDDHRPHPDYRTEWWYFTGNLSDTDDNHYGFELTLFRFALTPGEPQTDAALASTQIWMANLAVTDSGRKLFQAAERLSRGAPLLAGLQASDDADEVLLTLEDWSIRINGNAVFLAAGEADFGIELELAGLDRIVRQGEQGLDQKGPEPGNASYYYSAPRLTVSGELRSAGRPAREVTGSAWLDREWGTSALSPGVAGWDWFALQLDDGTDLMFYRLRTNDNQTSPFSGGSMTAADGSTTRLTADAVALAPTRSWTSPATRISYPVEWKLSVPDADFDLMIRPRIDDQEIDLTVRYWEGAVTVSGAAGDSAGTGVGYLELAGY